MKKVALSFFVVAASAGYVWSQWTGPAPLASLPPDGGDPIANLAQPVAAPPAAPPMQPVPFITGQTVTVPADQPAPARSAAAETPAEPPPLPKPAAPTEMAIAAPAPKPPEPAAQPAPSPAADVANPPPAPVQMAQAAPTTPPLPHPAPSFDNRTVPALLSPAYIASAAKHGTYTDGTYTGPTINVFYGLVQIQAVIQDGRLASINVLDYPSDRRTSVRINRQALPMLRDEVISAQSANVDIISGATLTSEGFIRSLDSALQKAKA